MHKAAGDTTAVVHNNGQLMCSGLQLSEVIDVRSGDAVTGIHERAIHIDLRELGAFQVQYNVPVLPPLRNVDGTRVGGRTRIAEETRQTGGFLPVRAGRTLPVGVHGPWQRDHGGGLSVLQAPLAAKVKAVASLSESRRQRGKSQKQGNETVGHLFRNLVTKVRIFCEK